jgi:hypothetical protein
MNLPSPAADGARRLLLLAILAALAACQGSDPQPLTLLSLDHLGGADSLVDGGGAAATLGYTVQDGTSTPTIRLVRHDAASPDTLAFLGDVAFTAGGRVTRLRVSDEAAGVILSGTVWVVDLAAPTLATMQLPAPDTAVDLAVAGRWVAVAVDHGLYLVDRGDPRRTFLQAAVSTPTALLATPGGFLAFTTAGYVMADTTSGTPAFAEVVAPALANLQAATPAGSGAMAAGPGSAFDRTRVVRLDLTDPAAPAVAASQEVSGAFAGFAWDGGDASVVAIHGDDDGAAPTTFHQGYLLREGGGGFHGSAVPLSFWSLSGQPLAARSGLLLAAGASGVALSRF